MTQWIITTEKFLDQAEIAQLRKVIEKAIKGAFAPFLYYLAFYKAGIWLKIGLTGMFCSVSQYLLNIGSHLPAFFMHSAPSIRPNRYAKHEICIIMWCLHNKKVDIQQKRQ